jgi:cysteine desulfurase
MIYLDNHATTPVSPEVLEKMMPFFSDNFGNAHSNDHSFGWYAEAAVAEARGHIARLINAGSDEIFFTCGATESNNIALMGIRNYRTGTKNHIITTSIEHKCILEITGYLAENGFTVTYLPVDTYGQISIEELKAAIRPETLMVSVMHANNEIGVVNDLEEIGAVCKANQLIFHTDAAQSLGKVLIDVDRFNIDILSASGHKIYGPKGAGFIYCRNTIRLAPVMLGGGQEAGLRPGTLNVTGIVGLGKACELADIHFEANYNHYLKLRNSLYTGLKNGFACFALNGPGIDPTADELSFKSKMNRLPNNLHFSFVGHKSKDIIRVLKNIAVSSGSACSSRSFEASHVLKATGIPDARISSSIRVGIGLQNNQDEIGAMIACLNEIIKEQPVCSMDKIIL